MSSPAWTQFCENGHIVRDCSHGYQCEEAKECSICGTKNIKAVVEWGDSDYPEGLLVSGEPIRHEYQIVRSKWGKKRGKIPVFDVSKLFSEKKN